MTSEIQAVIDEMMGAYVDRDVDRFSAFFADDIVAMPPGAPPIIGIEAWRKLLVGFFGGSAVTDMVSRSEEITVEGNVAMEWHNEAATFTMHDTGESRRTFNKGMWVFRRESGDWKVIRYVWNERPALEPGE